MARRRADEPRWLEGLINGTLLADGEIAPDATKEHSESFGAPALTQVMAISAMAGMETPSELQIADPVCGFGTSLLTVGRAAKSAGWACEAAGQDVVQPVIDIARARAAHYGIEAEFHSGDSLLDLRLELAKFDIVTCEMVDLGMWRETADEIWSLFDEGIFPLGIPSSPDPSWLLAQRALSLLKPSSDGGGRACLLMSLSELSSQDDHVRWRFAEEDFLEAVIELPGGLTKSYSAPLALVILNSAKPKRMEGRIHLIDMRSFFVKTGSRAGTLSEFGLRLLHSSLTTTKQGPQNRIVSYDELEQSVVMLHPSDGQGTPREWRARIRNVSTPKVAARYGAVEVEIADVCSKTLDIRPRAVFDEAVLCPVAHPGFQHAWTRLSALLLHEPTHHDDDADLWLPMNPDEPVLDIKPSIHQAFTARPSNQQVFPLRVDQSMISVAFLKEWLNSDAVTEQRKAFPNHWRIFDARYAETRREMVDELIVRLPTPQFSSAIIEATETIERAQGLVRQAKERIWNDDPASVADEFSDLLDRSVRRWTQFLPYPIASALWTFLGRDGVGDQREQALQTLEAYAVFNATVLLSVIRRDPEMDLSLKNEVSAVFSKEKLSFERATFGTWLVVQEKLSSALRQLEHDDDRDDIDRLRRLFGDGARSFITTATSASAVRILRQANKLRNDWSGHGGTVTEETRVRQVEVLTELLESLQAEVGRGWTRMPLVRAGRAAKRAGVFVQDVELVMGTSTPFAKTTMQVGEMMEDGQLYLCYDGCPDPIKLAPFVVLRSSPESEQYAAYFYNRVDGDQARMISYQSTRQGEATVSADQIFGGLGPDMPIES